MDINKEVEKFEVKKSKLVNNFAKRISAFIKDTEYANERITRTQEELDKQALANQQAIEEGRKALGKIQ